ncbi:MAG: prohibitin family protein [Luteibaculaceae bacterium]
MNQFREPSEVNLGKVGIFIIIGVGLLFLLVASSRIFIILEPTERGIIFRKFTSGLDRETIYGEGLNVIAPWNEMIIFDVSEQKIEETMDVLSQNGLAISVDVAIRYSPVPSRLADLFDKFRLNYHDLLVRQELRSAVRRIIGRFTAEELYSTRREEIEATIRSTIEQVLTANNVEMRALLIRSIKLPPTITAAIESKLQQEQESLAYQFRLEKEESEAERKRIEAEGSARANSIINSSLTPSLLKMRGIEATERLANSPNSKVVVIGGGKDGGLPLILGNN